MSLSALREPQDSRLAAYASQAHSNRQRLKMLLGRMQALQAAAEAADIGLDAPEAGGREHVERPVRPGAKYGSMQPLLDDAATTRERVQTLHERVRHLRCTVEQQKGMQAPSPARPPRSLEIKKVVAGVVAWSRAPSPAASTAASELGESPVAASDSEACSSLSPEGELLHQALSQWEAPWGAGSACAESFGVVDRHHDGKIQWSNGEVKEFIQAVLRRIGAESPEWSDLTWYSMYHRSDVDNSLSLDLEEAMQFTRMCLEARLRSLPRILTSPITSPVVESRSVAAPSLASAFAAAASQAKVISVDVEASVCGACSELMSPVRSRALITRVLSVVEKDTFREMCADCFRAADGDGDGHLQWGGDEVHGFIRGVFEFHSMRAPTWPDSRWSALYRAMDIDCSRPLPLAEAEALARRCLDDAGKPKLFGGC